MEEYRTRDLGEASALLAKKKQLTGLERQNNFYIFVFYDKGIKEVVHLYWFGNLMVDAKKYNEAMKKLKDRIYSVVS